MDTGSGHDLIGHAAVGASALKRAEPAANPLTLNTANGPVRVDRQVRTKVASLCTEVTPLLLADTPCGPLGGA